MEWYSWLSRTGLEPSLVYEYATAFAHNELEQEDIPYFNHEFLQSMGISIAKHRLEILKLSKRYRSGATGGGGGGGGGVNPMSRIIVAIKKAKKSLTKCISSWVARQDDGDLAAALVFVPRANDTSSTHSSRCIRKRSMVVMRKQEEDRSLMGKEERLMITNNTCTDPLMVVSSPKLESFSSPLVHDVKTKGEGQDREDGYWIPTLEKIRWDAMFQDLKPT